MRNHDSFQKRKREFEKHKQKIEGDYKAPNLEAKDNIEESREQEAGENQTSSVLLLLSALHFGSSYKSHRLLLASY